MKICGAGGRRFLGDEHLTLELGILWREAAWQWCGLRDEILLGVDGIIAKQNLVASCDMDAQATERVATEQDVLRFVGCQRLVGAFDGIAADQYIVIAAIQVDAARATVELVV